MATQPDAVAGADAPELSSPPNQQATSTVAEPVEMSTLPQSETPPPAEAPSQAPVSSSPGYALSISLMLTSGARHPYTIDERYLRSRNLEPRNSAGEVDPRELSGYQLKELIWTDWREEWEPKPANPSSIRLIILGRMIEDKSALKDFPFKAQPGDLQVVHMTVRPADLDVDDDGAAAKNSLHRRSRSHRSRDGEDGGEERGVGCRCVIL